MNAKVKIEIDAQTADLLKARATARGITVAELLAQRAKVRGRQKSSPRTRGASLSSAARAKACLGTR
jgi:hypothetical protein